MASVPAPDVITGDATAEAVEISVVMPCLNEAATLGICIDRAREALDRLGTTAEIVIADNGSTDGSQDIAREHGARVVQVARRGYGAALAGGIDAARGEFVLMGDADASYDFSHVGRFVAKLREGYDVVIGNRFAGGIEQGAMPFLHRYLGNPLLTWIARRVYGSPVGDVYCGLRAFRKETVQKLDLRSPGMEFAIEMVVKASIHGVALTEVPTTLEPDLRGRPPHLRTWRDGWRSLRFFMLYSPKWLFLYPGLTLIAAGVLISAWLIPGQRDVGPLTLDVHTLLYASLAVVVGWQSVGFWLAARAFAVAEGLLPRSMRLEQALRAFALERALGAALLLVVAGIAGSVYAVFTWSAEEFGRLDYASTLRIVVPSATAITLGFQTALLGFFLSILRLRDT